MSEEARSGPLPARRHLVAVAVFAGTHRTEAMPVCIEEATAEGFERVSALVPRLPELEYPFRNASHGLLVLLLEVGRVYCRHPPTILRGDPLDGEGHVLVFFRRHDEGGFRPEWYNRAALEAIGVRPAAGHESGARQACVAG